MVQSGTARHASAHSACPRRPVGTTKHATHRTNVMNAHRIPLFRVVGAVPGATTAEDDERTCVRSARNHAPRRTHPARVVSIVTPMVTQVTLKQQTVRECAADGHTDAWNRPQQSRRTNSNARELRREVVFTWQNVWFYGDHHGCGILHTGTLNAGRGTAVLVLRCCTCEVRTDHHSGCEDETSQPPQPAGVASGDSDHGTPASHQPECAVAGPSFLLLGLAFT